MRLGKPGVFKCDIKLHIIVGNTSQGRSALQGLEGSYVGNKVYLLHSILLACYC